MRGQGWLLGMMLLAGAPAMAACPPAGQDRADLQALKSNGFAVADAAGKQALAIGLVDCLGDPDPALRDGIAYEALQHWMRAGDFDAPFLRRLREALYAAMKEQKGSERHSVLLMLTDVVKEGTDLMVISDDPAMIEGAFGAKLAGNSMWIDGMMSRKKQTIPNLQKAFGC